MYPEAFERKLGPIYLAIDSRSFKAALKQIDAALKKYSGNQLLRALRSFALQRLGRSEEARAVLEGLVKDVPESERVLHTMTFTYKALGKGADIITAFEKAVEKQPNDGDIQLGLFSAYGREMKFAKQQQVALKLTKLDPGNADRYGWWVVACIALQAREAAQNQDSTRALQFMRLAETMLDRHVARFGRRLPSYEALLLHVDLLQGQGKVDDAVVAVENFLKDEGDATKKKASTGGTATERAHLLAAALARAGRFDPAAEIYKSECMKNVEDWWSWKLYLDCKLGLGSRERVLLAKDATSMYFPVGVVGGLAETWDRKHLAQVFTAYHRTQTLQSSMCEVETTLQDLKKAAGGRLTRGVALAIVELAVRQQDGCSSGLPRGPILEALEVLAPTFSCVADLHGYLRHFAPRDEQATEVFVREMRRVCEGEAARMMGVDDAPHAELKALQCLVNAATLAEEIRAPVCPDYATAFDEAAGHVALFARHLHVSENLDPKDRGFGVELIALAASTLVCTWRTKNRSPAAANDLDDQALPLLAAILALEAAQVRRTVAAPLRLCSCALHGVLGAPQGAAEHFAALDIKNVQHESLTAHWLLPALVAAAARTEDLEPWLRGFAHLHSEQTVEAADALVDAFEHGTYSKLAEFVSFTQRLETSRSGRAARAEAVAAELRDIKDVDRLFKRVIEAAGSESRPGSAAAAAIAAEKERDASAVASIDSSSNDTTNLSFNEDFTQRPVWFPCLEHVGELPFDGVTAWWLSSMQEEHVRRGEIKNHPSACMADLKSGLSHRWWTLADSQQLCEEESSMSAVRHWRESQRRALEFRTALPSLLAAALRRDPLTQEELTRLRNIVLDDDGDEESKSDGLLLELSIHEDPGQALVAQERLLHQRTTRVLFSVALDVQAALWCGAPHHAALSTSAKDEEKVECEALAERATSQCVYLGILLRQTCLLIQKLFETSMSGSVASLPLPLNAGTALAAQLLTEDAFWLSTCLLTWQPVVSDAKAPAEMSRLRSALGDLAGSLHSAITDVATVLKASADVDVDEVATRVLGSLESRYNAERLWAYESSFDPGEALRKFLGDQKATAERLHGAAVEVSKRLAGWKR